MSYLAAGLGISLALSLAGGAALWYRGEAKDAQLETEKQKAAVALQAIEKWQALRDADEEWAKDMKQSYEALKGTVEGFQATLGSYNRQVNANENSKRPLDANERAALSSLLSRSGNRGDPRVPQAQPAPAP